MMIYHANTNTVFIKPGVHILCVDRPCLWFSANHKRAVIKEDWGWMHVELSLAAACTESTCNKINFHWKLQLQSKKHNMHGVHK